jgi:hypothetical protein
LKFALFFVDLLLGKVKRNMMTQKTPVIS